MIIDYLYLSDCQNYPRLFSLFKCAQRDDSEGRRRRRLVAFKNLFILGAPYSGASLALVVYVQRKVNRSDNDYSLQICCVVFMFTVVVVVIGSRLYSVCYFISGLR
jgi:hypothetical protein